MREQIIGAQWRADDFYGRAIARGEADLAVLTPRVRALAFDLLRKRDDDVPPRGP